MQTIILMLSGSADNFDGLTRTVSACDPRYQTRRADDVATALARVAGGGVVLVLVDVSAGQEILAALARVDQLRSAAPGLPLAIWADASTSNAAALASRAGILGCVAGSGDLRELKRILETAVERRDSLATRTRPAPANATVVAVMGVKGGVGTSTVAMNTAAALTASGSVILAEIRPMFGSLHSHFHPGRMIRGFSNHGSVESAESETRGSLWPVPGVPGLRVLFGPQTPADCGEIEGPGAAAFLYKLADEADFVVVDLPVSLSAANRAILGASHHLLLVLDPSAPCLALGQLTLEGIQSWARRPASIAAVVVKHHSEGLSLSLPDIESGLRIPISGVILPAPDLCLHGERARLPMIQCDPESLAADSFLALARCFPRQSSLPARQLHPPVVSATMRSGSGAVR